MSAEPNPQARARAPSINGAAPLVVTDLASKTLAVKEGETFLYCDLEGNLDHGGDYGLGLYSRDTRFLSHFRMTISGRDPVLLSSSSERGYMAYVDLTNPNLYEGEEVAVAQQSLNIRRIRAINGRLFERVRLKTTSAAVSLDLEFAFGADFAYIFGFAGWRGRRGRHRGHSDADDGTSIRLHRSHDIYRVTRIAFRRSRIRRRRRRGRHGHLPASPRPYQTKRSVGRGTHRRRGRPPRCVRRAVHELGGLRG